MNSASYQNRKMSTRRVAQFVPVADCLQEDFSDKNHDNFVS